MLRNRFQTLMIGGKAAAVAALMGGAALAQTSTTETVIVPAPALEPGAPVGIIAEGDFPILEQLDNDRAVAETLIAQGFTDVHILREGALMTVTAMRAGEPIELVYSVATGRLVSVDGQETRPPADTSGEADAPDSDPESAPQDGGTDTGGTDTGGTDTGGTDTGATDDGGMDGGPSDDGAGDDGGGDTGDNGAGGEDSGTDSGSNG